MKHRPIIAISVLLGVIALAIAFWQKQAGPKAANAPAYKKASSEWVSLTGGCFQMGETRIYPEEGPVQSVCLEPFQMQSHEVTNAQFKAFVDATGYVTRAEKGWAKEDAGGPQMDLAPSSAVFVPNAKDVARNMNWWQLMDGASWRRPLGPDSDYRPRPDDPVVHITRADAQAYADWAAKTWPGARLPSEAEWEYAARGGKDGKLLAWETAESIAVHDMANTWQGVFPALNSGEDGYEGVAPIGQYPANGFGLYDMIGNVWEWTSTPYAPSHRDQDRNKAGALGYDPAQPSIPVGTIRGGSFLCAKSYCYRFRPAARQAQDLIFGTSHIGFRLAADIAPEN